MLETVAGGAMSLGLAKAYGAQAFGPAALNIFFAQHISHLKASDVELVAQTGLVLDGATAGFGIGYVASTAVIAAGQLMLGNTLDMAIAVGTAATFTNPTAATCAAIGAVFYGYHALSDEERTMFLSRLESGLEIGRELIKSLITYVETALTQLLDSDMMRSLRELVTEYAAMFGNSISDITRSVSDRAVLLAHQATTAAYDAASSVGNVIYSGANKVSSAGNSLGTSAHTISSESSKWASNKSEEIGTKILSLFQSGEDRK